MSKKILLVSLIPLIYLLLLLFRVDTAFEGDLGRQIMMGNIVTHCRCIPQTNTFSFTYPSYPSVNYSWFSDLIFFLIAQRFGVISLLYTKILLILISFAIVYGITVKKSPLFTTLIFTLLSITLFSDRLIVRPEIFSYFFICLILLLFELYKKFQKLFILYFIPIIMVLWVNMHIYFFIGIFLTLFFLLEQWQRRKMKKSGVIIMVSVVIATFINIQSIQGALYPFLIFHNYGAGVSENIAPVLLLLSNIPLLSPLIMKILLFEVLSIFLLSTIVFERKTQMLSLKLTGIFGILIGQYLLRGVAIFSLLGLPFLGYGFSFLQKKFLNHFGKEFIYTVRLFLVGVVIFFVVVTITDSPTTLGFSYVDPAKKGVDFFIKNNLHGPIYNNFTLGNYLIYRLYPKEKVYVDGRPEAYPASFFEEYYKALGSYDYFNEVAKKRNINVVFYGLLDEPEKTKIFLKNLSYDKKWAPVFWDRNTIIFLRNNSVNKSIIGRHRLSLQDNFISN